MRSALPGAALLLLFMGTISALPAAEQSSISADDAHARARALYTEEGPSTALPVFLEALELYRAAGDRHGEAITLGLIGNCHKRLGDYDKALELLAQALTMKRELGDRLEEGKTLSHLGLVYWEQADYDRAIEHLDDAAAIGREVDDPKLEGAALNNLSLVYDELGDYDKSLEQYGRALELFRATGFTEGESYVLGNIGGVHLLLGQFNQAMGFYEQALELSEQLESKPSMSMDLGNLALCHLGIGEIDRALERLDTALELAREAGLAKEEADWLKGKGDVLFDTGRHGEGLDFYRQALAAYESAGLARERTETLSELAALHLELGDLATAGEYLQSAVDAAREIDFTRGVLASLTALGDLERRRNRFDVAANYLEQALDGAVQAGEPTVVASCRRQLAETYRDQGVLERALEQARQAFLESANLDSRMLQAEALYTLGDIELEQGHGATALPRFHDAAELVADLGQPDIAWRIAHRTGRALEAEGKLEEAVTAYRHAVELIETVRGRLHEERFRASYIEDKHDVYVDLSRLLVVLDRDAEAFAYAEKLRARAYLDLLSRDGLPRLTADQRRRELALRQRIRQLRRSLDDELDPAWEPRRQAVSRFVVELDRAERDYQEFLTGLSTVDPDLATTWTLSVPESHVVQAGLAPGTALIEFVVGEDETIVFAMTRDDLVTRLAPIDRKNLRAKVRLVRELVRRPERDDWRYAAASLAETLITPVLEAERMQSVRHLILVPHDVLHYLPFALLPRADGDSPLIESFTLSYLPAAGTLVLGDRTRPERSGLLAFAPAIARLRHSEAEARAIAETVDGPRRVLVGADATERSFKELAGDFGTIHLATHNTWNQLNPLFSALELEPGGGEDGRLEVHEILDLDLDAALVTLSACETALGAGFRGTTPVGDDFVGLTRAFFHAGTEAVVASLWDVDDRSTLELMERFYSRLGENGNPAEAMATAQREMLANERSAPYHWAPFIVVGRGGSR